MDHLRLFYGYRIVFTLVLTCFIPLSLGLSCAGIFYPSLALFLEVEPGILSYYTSFLWLASLVTLPVMGNILNKGDARVFMTVAVIIIIAAFLWLSFLQELWQYFVAAFAIGIAVGMLLFLAPSTLINRWFQKRAGFLLGIVMAFTGIGGVVWSSVGGILIQQIGWSATYLVFAGLCVCTLPFTIFMVSSHPQDKGLLPFGYEEKGNVTQDNADSQGNTLAPANVAAKTAFRMPSFYLICIACFLLNLGMYFYFMIPSYAVTLPVGLEFPLLGATASSVAMAGQTISKLILGAVGERIPRTSTTVALAMGIIGILLFGFFGDALISFYLAAFLYGAYYGITNVMMPIFTRLCFGTMDYAKIYSRISMVASIGSTSAAFIWAPVIDATGSYYPFMIGLVIMMAITMGAILLIHTSRK